MEAHAKQGRCLQKGKSMKSWGKARGALAAASVLGLVLLPSTSASAAEGSNWWYDYYQVGQAQSEGWTGEGVKVAVLDNQINPDLPVFAGSALRVDSKSVCSNRTEVRSAGVGAAQHGTTSTALIVGNGTGGGAVRGIAPRADVTFYGYGGEEDRCTRSEIDGLTLSGFGVGLRRAIADGNRILTTSIGTSTYSPDDLKVLAAAIRDGVIVVAATPNDPYKTVSFPTNLNGVVSVNAFQQDGAVQTSSDGQLVVIPEVSVLAPGELLANVGSVKDGSWDSTESASGASVAAPLVAGMLAVAWQKYPSATGNQLVQSLIHNTTADDHPLARDMTEGYGYGPASLSHLLRVDPTQYPDVNPLMDKEFGEPSAADVRATPSATPQPGNTPSASAGGERQMDSGAMTVLVIGGIVAFMILAALVVVIVVVGRKSAAAKNSATNNRGTV